MNRSGVTAFVDCMIFLLVISAAIAVTISFSEHEGGTCADPEDFLSRLSKTEVRLSDLTDVEDDTLVYIADVMAYDTAKDSLASEYLKTILDTSFGEHRYLMEYTYSDNTVIVGDLIGFHRSESSKDIRLSNGDTINVTLRLW